MIVTQYKGKSFTRTLRYVVQKPGAKLLAHNLMRSTVEQQSAAMVAVASRSKRVQKPMMHYAISLSPGERLNDSEWRSLAKQYLQRMGYRDNQYLLVRHTDTPHHDHVHLVVNRVQRGSGKAVCLDWDYYQSQALVRQLEEQFHLSAVRASWEPFHQRLAEAAAPRLRHLPLEVQQRQAAKEQIRGVVNASLLGSRSLEEFMSQVERSGVRVELQQRQGQLKGIAFSLDNERFAGSRLGPSYSLPKLMQAWNAQAQEQEQIKADDPANSLEMPFHQRYYQELVAVVERKLGRGLSTQQQDFQIAMLALRSSHPDAAQALVFSPDVQTLKREQGELAAMDYLRQLMEKAQQRLKKMSQSQTQTVQERGDEPSR